MDVSSKWWLFRGFSVEIVVFSCFSLKWLFFRGFFVEIVVFSVIFQGIGDFFRGFFFEMVVFSSLSDPNGPINSKYTFFQHFLPFKGATRNLEPAPVKRAGPSLCHFEVTLAPHGIPLGFILPHLFDI